MTTREAAGVRDHRDAWQTRETRETRETHQTHQTHQTGPARPAHQTGPASPAVFRADIEGLRALAVVAVILDHLIHWPTGGFVGVDVFFVISGFLITGLLLREYRRTGRFSFSTFYRRRIKRIIPAAALVLVAAVFASSVLLPAERARAVLWDGVASVFFASNWRMAAVGTDYFQVGLPPSPLQNFWSLAVEEQFYLVWPWLLLGVFALAAARRWPARTVSVAVAVVLGALVVASFAWSVHDTATAPGWSYFSTFSRAWELGVGALVAVAAGGLARLPDPLRIVMGLAGLAGILTSYLLITTETVFPGTGALLPVASSALLIAAGTGAAGPAYFRAMIALSNPVSRYLGKISYSLYLWHWPIFVLLVALLPSNSPLYYVSAVLITAVLSILCFHFIEDPIRQSSWLDRRPRGRERPPREPLSLTTQLTSVGTLVLIAVTLLGLASMRPEPAVTARPYVAPVSSAVPVGGAGPAAVVCLGADYLGPKRDTCDRSAVGSGVTPSVEALADDIGRSYECWIGDGARFKSCTYGSTRTDALRVALVGDSHGAMLISGLIDSLPALNWTLDTYVGYGCQWKTPLSGSCTDTMAAMADALETGPAYDLVVTTGTRKVGGDRETASAAFSAAWTPVIARGTKVVAVADVPEMTEEALSCLARIGFDPVSNDCATSRDEAFGTVDPLIHAVESTPGATLVDMTDFFCGPDVCPAVIGNVIVYRDAASHVSTTYMKTLSPYLIERIRAAMA